MKLKFTKMHGAGNDFIVLNAIDQVINLTPEQYRFLADRRYGIGADQILLVEISISNTGFSIPMAVKWNSVETVPVLSRNS